MDEKNNYEKNKLSIYKWRNNNKAEYLLQQHLYMKNKLLDPIKKEIHRQRCKAYRDKKESR